MQWDWHICQGFLYIASAINMCNIHLDGEYNELIPRVRQLCSDSGKDMHEINYNYEHNEVDRCSKFFYTGYKQFKVYIQMCKRSWTCLILQWALLKTIKRIIPLNNQITHSNILFMPANFGTACEATPARCLQTVGSFRPTLLKLIVCDDCVAFDNNYTET